MSKRTKICGTMLSWVFADRGREPRHALLEARRASPLNRSVFRIDHDQAFQSTLNLRYQRPKNAEWVSLIYR